MLARFHSSISSFCFIYALTPLFEFLRYFGFPNALLWSSFTWLNLWDFIRTFLDRASDCMSRVLLVPIVVLSYAVLILFVRGALGVIGTFLFGFSNRIWGSHSPPLWSPVRSHTICSRLLHIQDSRLRESQNGLLFCLRLAFLCVGKDRSLNTQMAQ